jgi:mannose-6-phosphate isomerase
MGTDVGSVLPLRNAIRPYPWGSRTALAELQGRAAPTREPEAELWIGDHDAAPSAAWWDGGYQPLPRLFADHGEQLLGRRHLANHGGGLPFLLKVLAVDRPLSLQVHPTTEQARAGFAREEGLGIPRDADTRVYRDPVGKPELVYAIGAFEALIGFRPPDDALEFVSALRVEELDWLRRDLSSGVPLERIARTILTLPGDDVRAQVSRLASRSHAPRRPEAAAARWITALAVEHPDDRAVLLSLLLNYVFLREGEATLVLPGIVHAYLRGMAVEIMANSDNVVRAGLTRKHVAIEELEEVLAATGEVPTVLPGTRHQPHATFAPTGQPFELSCFVGPGTQAPLRRGRATVVLALGAAEVLTDTGCVGSLGAGEAVLVSASASRPLRVQGELFVLAAAA